MQPHPVRQLQNCHCLKTERACWSACSVQQPCAAVDLLLPLGAACSDSPSPVLPLLCAHPAAHAAPMSLLHSYEPRQRLSAAAALAHPWFGVVTPTAVISSTVASLGKVVSTVSSRCLCIWRRFIGCCCSAKWPCKTPWEAPSCVFL